MEICLVSPLTISDFADTESTLKAARKTMRPQLGILSLAAILDEQGIVPKVVDLNPLFLDFVKLDKPHRPAEFSTFAANHIRSFSFNAIGFSTICSSYPLTLRIAGEIAESNPGVQVILGGPQASVVDVATLEAFPFIHYVVRGEADETFPLLLDALSNKNSIKKREKIPGITFRRGKTIVRNADAPPILDLDKLPLPAFHLDPRIHDYQSLPLEVGRGCPFSCTFCSTSHFFGRRFRLKSPQKIVEQMKEISLTYKVSTVDLDHDMFTADRKKVIAFCDALTESASDIQWGCSARIDCIDNELIALMARAGCRGLFFGVETASPRLQKTIKKQLSLSDAIDRIQCADQHKIDTAVALITAFPDETKEELRETINFFIDSLRFQHAKPQIGLLAPLAGTEIHLNYQDKLVMDGIFSDMSYQGWRQNPLDYELIERYPHIFPNFYSIPTSNLNREYFSDVCDFVLALETWFRWLPVALLQDSGDFLHIYDRWQKWHSEKSAKISDKDEYAPYYNRRQFPEEFTEFIKKEYLDPSSVRQEIILALLEIEGFRSLTDNSSTEQHEEDVINNEINGALNLYCFPYKSRNIYLKELGLDYEELIHCLRQKSSPNLISRKKVTIAYCQVDEKTIEVHQLSPLSRELMGLCSGNQSMSEIMQQFSSLELNLDGIAADKACFFGIKLLCEQGFLSISPQPTAVP